MYQYFKVSFKILALLSIFPIVAMEEKEENVPEWRRVPRVPASRETSTIFANYRRRASSRDDADLTSTERKDEQAIVPSSKTRVLSRSMPEMERPQQSPCQNERNQQSPRHKYTREELCAYSSARFAPEQEKALAGILETLPIGKKPVEKLAASE